MRFLILMDSFRGSLASKESAELIRSELLNAFPSAEIVWAPAFDGGEGSLEYLTELFGGKLIGGRVADANFILKIAPYGVAGDRAIISVSASSGLQDAAIRDPFFTTTYGLGAQIDRAVRLGKTDVWLLLGGSSTNDGGAGAASALGAKFFDETGEIFVPTGGTLGRIRKTDLSEMRRRLNGVRFTGLCDAYNPLLGPNGCTYAYATQKGARTAEALAELESNMSHFAKATAFLGVDPAERMTGAAGGLGYFAKAFLGAELMNCAEYFFLRRNISNEIASADCVICGEGRFDSSSFDGKLCGKISDECASVGAPCVVFCGENALPARRNPVVYALNDPALTLAENIEATAEHLIKGVRKLISSILNGKLRGFPRHSRNMRDAMSLKPGGACGARGDDI